jgi:hypothetical protein
MVGKDWTTLLLTKPELILGEHFVGVRQLYDGDCAVTAAEFFWVWRC